MIIFAKNKGYDWDVKSPVHNLIISKSERIEAERRKMDRPRSSFSAKSALGLKTQKTQLNNEGSRH